MRQIVRLQVQLKGLYETLSKLPPKDIEQRLLLERQIQGIEDEISALKSALIATENKKVMELQKAQADKADAAKAAKADATVTPATPAPSTPSVNKVAARQPANVTAPSPPADQPDEAEYTSDGLSDPSSEASVGTNVDVVV